MKIDLVDVFGSGPLSGNPLAVVHGANDLSADQMLALTRWLGFSETTFVFPPTDATADYQVRIFYPGGELPFAGHPTLGSCYSWLKNGGVPRNEGTVIQECGVGLVEVRSEGEQLAFKAPALSKSGPLNATERDFAIKMAGANPDSVVEAVHVQNGPGWQMLRLRSANDVIAAEPAAKAPPGTDIGIVGPCENGAATDWELRAFFSDASGRFVEDPVTGSFNAGVAMHLFTSGLADGSYRASQGRKTGADGLVHCQQETDDSVWIGGRCRLVSQGGALHPIG